MRLAPEGEPRPSDREPAVGSARRGRLRLARQGSRGRLEPDRGPQHRLPLWGRLPGRRPSPTRRVRRPWARSRPIGPGRVDFGVSSGLTIPNPAIPTSPMAIRAVATFSQPTIEPLAALPAAIAARTTDDTRAAPTSARASPAIEPMSQVAERQGLDERAWSGAGPWPVPADLGRSPQSSRGAGRPAPWSGPPGRRGPAAAGAIRAVGRARRGRSPGARRGRTLPIPNVAGHSARSPAAWMSRNSPGPPRGRRLDGASHPGRRHSGGSSASDQARERRLEGILRGVPILQDRPAG